MADISKIKTLDETTYNIKDTVARSTKLDKNAELLTTNPFAPNSVKGPYISKIDNAFYAADKRWNVTATNLSGNISYLFDGSYDSETKITDGKTSVITIDFSTESNSFFPGYPYGYILISFYYVAGPASISGRVYCNYETHGIGWHDISFSPLADNSINNIVYKSSHQEYYNISKIEITIVGDTTNSYGMTSPTQIEMHLDRPSSQRTPFLSKYNAETLYYPLTAPNFIGKINNYTVNSDVPANAKFTDTTYESKAAASGGTALSLVTTGEKYTWNNKGSGTITGIKMNGASKGTSGVVDLGTVITAHQDISGKLNTSLKGAVNGLAELDANGKVPSSQLPSYVDDVLEYAKQASFPSTGETGKIYIDLATNKTYRWSGSAYVEISQSLALGTTSSTAYRGDYGNAAYTHAVTNKGSAFTSGLYKITTNSEGHVTAATAVTKTDITALGIPGSDTNTKYTASTSKLVTTTVPNVTSAGSAPTLGTAIPADDITEWTTNVPTNFKITGEKLKITVGSSATLKYTAKSIPNVTSIGSAPTFGTAITVATGTLASNGSGGTVVTGITAS